MVIALRVALTQPSKHDGRYGLCCSMVAGGVSSTATMTRADMLESQHEAIDRGKKTAIAITQFYPAVCTFYPGLDDV